jgi:hypothetical protein
MIQPTAPNLSGVLLPFKPVSYWQAGEFDADALCVALKQQAELGNFEDAGGNIQSAVRLDHDADPTNVGFWISVPEGTAQSVIDAAVAVYQPPPPPPPPDPFVPASVAVETAVAAAMATVAITSPNLTDAQKQTIQTQVTTQVQAVIDQHLGA